MVLETVCFLHLPIVINVRPGGQDAGEKSVIKCIFPSFFSSSSSEALEIIHTMFELLGAISWLHMATIVFSASIVWNQIWIQRQVGWTFTNAKCTCSSLWSHCAAPYRLPWVNGRKLSPALQDRTIMKFCFRLSFYLDIGQLCSVDRLDNFFENLHGPCQCCCHLFLYTCAVLAFLGIFVLTFLNKIFCIYTFVDLF